MQNPQADHCRLLEVGTYCRESQRLDQWVPELVLQERWRVWHPNTPTNTRAFGVRILMNWRIHCCSCRDGLKWTGTGYPDWWQAGTKDSHSMTSRNSQSGDCLLSNLLCAKDTDRKADSHPDHIVCTLSVKLNVSFYLATYNVYGVWQSITGVVASREICPHPSLYPEDVCVSNETMSNIPVDSDMGESLERRCVWMCGMLVQYLWFSLEKTGLAACAFLNEQLNVRRNRHHGNWNGNCVQVGSHTEFIYFRTKEKGGQWTWCFWSGVYRLSRIMNCLI